MFYHLPRYGKEVSRHWQMVDLKSARRATRGQDAMDQQYTVGIIGYGKVGRTRHRIVGAHPRLRLIAVCDVSPPSKDEVGVSVHTQWQAVLDMRPDIVFVCTTNEMIPDIAVAALDAGCHVFCEKPPGRTVADIEKMRAAENAHPHLKLKFGFNHRYHEAVRNARMVIERGRLGRLLWARGIYGKAGGNAYDRNWRNDPARSGGGILIDQGIHMMDLMRMYCGDFVDFKAYLGAMYWNLPVEDNAFVMMRTAEDRVAMLHSSATQWRHRFKLDLYLERGFLELEGILSSTQTYGRESLKIARVLYDAEGYPLPNPDETISFYSEDRSWELEVEDFVRAIDLDLVVGDGNSADALAVMQMVQAVYSQGDQLSPLSAPLAE